MPDLKIAIVTDIHHGEPKLTKRGDRALELLDHFLDSTVLNDQVTTLREHCSKDPSARHVLETLRESDDEGDDEKAG